MPAPRAGGGAPAWSQRWTPRRGAYRLQHDAAAEQRARLQPSPPPDHPFDPCVAAPSPARRAPSLHGARSPGRAWHGRRTGDHPPDDGATMPHRESGTTCATAARRRHARHRGARGPATARRARTPCAATARTGHVRRATARRQDRRSRAPPTPARRRRRRARPRPHAMPHRAAASPSRSPIHPSARSLPAAPRASPPAPTRPPRGTAPPRTSPRAVRACRAA